MRTFVILLFAFSASAQNIRECERRFNNYLNFKNSLNNQVIFQDSVIYILKGGVKTLALYNDELTVLTKLFEQGNVQKQASVIFSKKLNHWSRRQLDSLDATIVSVRSEHRGSDTLPLRGFRVALDPGHFGTNMQDALVEQKYLYFVRPAQRDTIQLFESTLTFNTASILRSLLEEQGASVLVTRSQADFTSFECTYQDFLKLHRKRTLDSLRANKELSLNEYRLLLTCSDYDFFWKFFRDYDLSNRVARINRFAPHATAIIHYNVDEKNVPWKGHSQKDYTMAFIGGAFVASDLNKNENKLHFLRLLLTDQLTRSETLAAHTVQNFRNYLEVPVATARDATYLYRNCINTSSPGVFCRNLVLCRKVNSPLVYGESLYQDNEKECEALMNCNVNMYGVITSDRITKVAASYFEALSAFLQKKG